jgi:hypothetical protein
MNDKVHGNLDHTFWALPKNVKNIKALADFMQSDSMKNIFGDYEIIAATGELNNNIDKVKNKIRQAANRKRKSITLSCYRFKEGTTVPEWGGVIMLDDGKSPEEYLQAIFRCQSPGERNEKGWPEKENCYVFDYNPQRFTVMYHDIAQWASKTGKEGEFDTTKEFLKYAPVHQIGENGMVEANAEDIIKSFHQHASFKEQMANDGVFNFANIDKITEEDYLDAFSNISASKEETRNALNDQGGSDQTKNAKITRTPKEDQEDDEDEEDQPIGNVETQKEKIRNFLKTIPTFLIASKADEKNVDEVINTDEPDLFEEICGVKPDVLNKLVNRDEILSLRMINQRIEY